MILGDGYLKHTQTHTGIHYDASLFRSPDDGTGHLDNNKTVIHLVKFRTACYGMLGWQ